MIGAFWSGRKRGSLSQRGDADAGVEAKGRGQEKSDAAEALPRVGAWGNPRGRPVQLCHFGRRPRLRDLVSEGREKQAAELKLEGASAAMPFRQDHENLPAGEGYMGGGEQRIRRAPVYAPVPPERPEDRQRPRIRWGRVLLVLVLLAIASPVVMSALKLTWAFLSEPPPEVYPFTHDYYRLLAWGIVTGLVVGGLIRLLRRI